MSKGKGSKNDVKNRIKATKFFYGQQEVKQAVFVMNGKKMIVMENCSNQEIITENGIPLPWSMAAPTA